MRRFATLAAAVVAAVPIAVAAAPAGNAADPPKVVDLKVLVLHSAGAAEDLQLSAWRATLDQMQVPYDVVTVGNGTPLTESVLEVSPTHGRYEAVIVTDNMLSDWAPGIPAADKAALFAYEAAFKVRQITDAGTTDPAYGLFSDGVGCHDPTTLGPASLTQAGTGVFGYLNPSITVPYESGTCLYPAAPYRDNASTWFPWGVNDVTSVEPLVHGDQAYVGYDLTQTAPAAIVSLLKHGTADEPDQREDIVTTVNSSWWTQSDKLLHPGELAWATRGVFLGQQRNYLTIHVDDVFGADDQWSVATHANSASLPVIRMTPADVDYLAGWQKAKGLQVSLAFNGSGTAEAASKTGMGAGKKEPLLRQFLSYPVSTFSWINHTYQHSDMTSETTQQISKDIKQNLDWARLMGLPVDGRELVTGAHTGLHNPAMAAALKANGVTRIAADASVTGNPLTIGPATVVERHPTDLYYNVANQAEQLDEYNWTYVSTAAGGSCTGQWCYSAKLTWDEYVDTAARGILQFVLANDPRPQYLHQDNLLSAPASAQTFYPVANRLLSLYDAWFSVRPLRLSMVQAGDLVTQQRSWKTGGAGVTGYVEVGTGVVHLTGGATTTWVPVSGTSAGDLSMGVRSAWVSVPAGQAVTLS